LVWFGWVWASCVFLVLRVQRVVRAFAATGLAGFQKVAGSLAATVVA